MGVDCLSVGAEHIREAWQMLREAELVLGPATDGGYWLVGLSRLVPELFRDMPWSSGALFQRTEEAARRQGLSVALLETLGDIDTEEDWLAYKRKNATRAINKPSL